MGRLDVDPNEVWNAAIGAVPPVPYNLKSHLPDRWVRFYALPDGKRYPTEPSEMEEVLTRGNVLLAEACAIDEYVMVVSGLFGPPGSPPEMEEPGLRAHPGAVYWRECEADHDDDNDWVPHLFASTASSANAAFDQLLRAVTEELVVFAMIVAPRQRVVVHPYDGGFDVILPDARVRDLWRSRHSKWASPRPDGL